MDDSSARARLRKGTDARSLAVIELQVQAPFDSEDAFERLDRADLARAMEKQSDRLVQEASDEWIDSPTDARVLAGEDRVLIRLDLPDETREQLAQRLDRLYDLAFDLASSLRLDVADPQMGSVVTRLRYEQHFQRFLEAYYTRARTAVALSSRSGWTELDGDADRGSELPAIETELDGLPSSVWGKARRALGVLEFSGERALRALSALDASRPFVAIVPPDVQPGDDAAILRVRRLVHPVAGLALVEVRAEGVVRIESVDRSADALRLQLRSM